MPDSKSKAFRPGPKRKPAIAQMGAAGAGGLLARIAATAASRAAPAAQAVTRTASTPAAQRVPTWIQRAQAGQGVGKDLTNRAVSRSTRAIGGAQEPTRKRMVAVQRITAKSSKR